MPPSLKDVTERGQKYDFSVNFHILIEQTGFRWHFVLKVENKLHCAFLDLTYDVEVRLSNFKIAP